MQSAVADVLAVWREAEALLETTEPGQPDHETALLVRLQMQTLYRRLTDTTIPGSDQALASSRDLIESGRSLLARIRHGR